MSDRFAVMAYSHAVLFRDNYVIAFCQTFDKEYTSSKMYKPASMVSTDAQISGTGKYNETMSNSPT